MPEVQKQYISKQNEQKLLSLWILSSREGNRQRSRQSTACSKVTMLQSRRIEQDKGHPRGGGNAILNKEKSNVEYGP